MKNFFLMLAMSTVLIACSSSSSKNDKKETNNNLADITQNPDYQKGLALVSKADCFTCHKIDEPLTGPPYREVANKYANMPDTIVDYLAKKIISGGSGNWGAVMMVPHAGVSMDDARAMVKYILLLKK